MTLLALQAARAPDAWPAADAPPAAMPAAAPDPLPTPALVAAPVVSPTRPAASLPQPALPRHEGLAAITALSDEEKIALFS